MKNKVLKLLSLSLSFCCLIGCNENSNNDDLSNSHQRQFVVFDTGVYECKNCLYHSDSDKDIDDGPFECPVCHENEMYVVRPDQIKDFSAGIKAIDGEQIKKCPFSNSHYLANTQMDFILTIYTNKGETLTGDVVSFPAALSGEGSVVDGVHYATFGSYKYDSSYDKTTYILHFTQKGEFDLHLKAKGQGIIIRINCDDNNLYWAHIVNISDVLPWMKNLSATNVTKVKEKHGTYGGAVDKFQDVTYSTNSNDISSMCNLFNLEMVKINTYTAYTTGEYCEYTYFANGSSNTVRIEGKKYVVTNDGNYMLMNQNFSIDFDGSAQKAYSFMTKSKMVGVDGVNLGTISNMIDYLDKIDFVEWGNAPMDDNEATFIITDPAVIDDFSQLYIYDTNRFSYKNVFYKIISEQNFSSLFA